MVEGPYSYLNWRLIYAMIVENNAIRLREIRCAIFENIQSTSIPAIDRVLKGHKMKTAAYI